MEIRVNQQAKQKQLDEVVVAIINKAQGFADMGIDQFVFNFPSGVNIYSAIIDVKKQTNETVYVPSRGISGKEVTFCIKD